MRGFERKKNRYIYISTKALVAQWEFRWRINWQISSQLPACPVYREDLFGRPGEDWWDFVTVYHQDVASHFPRMGNKGCALSIRAERFHRLWRSARLRSWCSGTAASKFQISDRKLKDLFLFSFFFFLESAIVIGGILSNSFFRSSLYHIDIWIFVLILGYPLSLVHVLRAKWYASVVFMAYFPKSKILGRDLRTFIIFQISKRTFLEKRGSLKRGRRRVVSQTRLNSVGLF